jgi:hypothetical protein
VAVIVSEETGAISLAVAGQIERELSAEQLRERLSELLHRYLPPTALPTPIGDTAENGTGSDFERQGMDAGRERRS